MISGLIYLLLLAAPLPWVLTSAPPGTTLILALAHLVEPLADPGWERVIPATHFDTALHAVALSDDGKTFAALGADGRLCAFEVGQPAPKWCEARPHWRGFKSGPFALAISPTGANLAVAGPNGAEMLRGDDGTSTGHLPEARQPLRFSAGGTLAAGAKRVRVWRPKKVNARTVGWASTGEPVPMPAPAGALAFGDRHGDSMLACHAQDEFSLVVRIDTVRGSRGEPLLSASTGLAEHRPEIMGTCTALAVSADGSRVAAAVHQSVLVWTWPAGEAVGDWTVPGLEQGTEIGDLAFSPSGKEIWCLAGEQFIALNTSTGAVVRRRDLPEGTHATPRSVTLASAGSIAAGAGGFGALWAFRTTDGRRAWSRPGALPFVGSVVALDPVRRRAWVGSDDTPALRAISVEDASQLGETTALEGGITGLATPAGAPHWLTVSPNGDVQYRDWDTGSPVASHTLDGCMASALAARATDLRTAVGCRDGRVLIFSRPGTEGGAALAAVAAHQGAVTALAFSPNGESVASTAEDGALALWDARTGAKMGRANANEETGQPGTGVCFSPDGTLIASTHAFVGDRPAVIVRHTGTMEERRAWTDELGATACAFTKDNNIVFTTLSGQVKLADLKAPAPQVLCDTDAAGYALSLAFDESLGAIAIGTGGQERGIRIFRRR